MTELLIVIFACALGIALLAGPLGSLVVWRKLAYFGDTLAHSALLGLALSIFFNIHPLLCISSLAVLIGLALWKLEKNMLVGTDSLLGALSHISLAFGLVFLSLSESANINLEAFLFGDLLAVSITDVWIIFSMLMVSTCFVFYYWRELLLISVDAQLAKVEGVAVNFLNMAFTLLLAVVIAVAIKIVGVLLITALLIVPAVTARRISSSPEAMIFFASFFACISVIGGILLSWQYDTPAGPSIVVCAAILFIVSLALPQK